MVNTFLLILILLVLLITAFIFFLISKSIKEHNKSIAYNFAILQIEKNEFIKNSLGEIIQVELYKKEKSEFIGNKDSGGVYIFLVKGVLKIVKVKIVVFLADNDIWQVSSLDIID